MRIMFTDTVTEEENIVQLMVNDHGASISTEESGGVWIQIREGRLVVEQFDVLGVVDESSQFRVLDD